MAHSNRLKIHWSLVIIEVVIFILALVAVYLSENSHWSGFSYIAAFSVLLYVCVKYFDANPSAKELLVQEDFAARISKSALEYGVVDYFNMQAASGQVLRNEETQKEIRNARSLWLCANSGASYIEQSLYRHWPFIEQKLMEDVEFRIVLLDPFSSEKKFRNKLNVGDEQFDSKLNLANLIRLLNKFPNLDIRFAKCGMHLTVFATDNCMFFDPYHVGLINERIENRSFSLRIKHSEPNEGVGLYRMFKSHFNSLWRSSTMLGDWLEANSERLPENLPDLNMR